MGIRYLAYGLKAGTYELGFKDKKGRRGAVVFKACDGVDLEYSWREFAAEHGFSVEAVDSLKEVQ